MHRPKLLNLKVVNSTNLFALEHLETLTDKQVIISDIQTNGRGRFNRHWVGMNSGNIYMSVILKPEVQNYPYANLTQYLSVVLCRVLEDNYGVSSVIKWPNDILVDGAKISGILCETSLKQNKIDALVLGLGVNLNMPQETLNSIDQKAVSLNILLGKEIDRDEFLNNLLEVFFASYNEFVNNGFSYIVDEYIARCKFLGEKVKISSLDENEFYVANSINEDGTLNISDGNNNQINITTGDLVCY